MNEVLDIVVIVDNAEGVYRHPHRVARALTTHGYLTRSVTVVDTSTGLTSSSRDAEVGDHL